MKLHRLTRLGALASASVLMLSAAGAVSAASVTPTFHEGNITAKTANCPTGNTAIEIAGGAASASGAGVTVTVTYHDDNSIDFAATGGTVSIAFVKGGENYNEYAYSPSVASDTNLVSPAVGADNSNIPAVSHTVFCVAETPPPPPERNPEIDILKTVDPTTLPVGGGDVTYTYVVTNTGDVPLTDVAVRDDNGTPANTADDFDVDCPKTELAVDEAMTCTADVSGTTETTTNIATATGKDGDTTVTDTDDATVTVPPAGGVGTATDQPGGGVEAETDVPAAPQTDTVGATAGTGSSLPVLLVILGIIGLAAVLLTPRRARR
jgi:hypothetical protein